MGAHPENHCIRWVPAVQVRMELYAEEALLQAIRHELDLSEPFMFASAVWAGLCG